MNKSFDILNLISPNYRFLIINKDFNPLNEKLSDINRELSQKNYIGKVIFNTLTSTCNKKKQYSRVFFNGKEILLSTLRPLRTVDRDIQDLIAEYFAKNRSLIDSLPFSITEG